MYGPPQGPGLTTQLHARQPLPERVSRAWFTFFDEHSRTAGMVSLDLSHAWTLRYLRQRLELWMQNCGVAEAKVDGRRIRVERGLPGYKWVPPRVAVDDIGDERLATVLEEMAEARAGGIIYVEGF